MKEIIAREEKGTLGSHTGEWAIFSLSGFQFYGNDIDDEYVILVNGVGNFIIGKKYPNCISVGSEEIKEFRTFIDAENEIRKLKIMPR